MRNRTTGLTMAATALLVGLAGCLPAGITLPQHFVQVDKSELNGYAARGVSADGVVVALRARGNLKNGSLEFWAKATENELTGRGYRLKKTEDIRSDGGLAGKLLVFAVDSRGAPFTYAAAVYVRPDQVLVAEAGGKEDAFKAREADILKSLRSVR